MVEVPWNAGEIIASARENLPARQSILVTGASGFVGGRLANVLAAAGHVVTATARNPYRVSRHPSVDFQMADLRDAERMVQLCEGKHLVFHAGADSSPWGDFDQMYAVNVLGTRNVLDACRQHQARMVHVSSTAVFFDHRDRPHLNDDAPRARRFSCNYAQTKAAAEDSVRESAPELDVTAVRARAVFGPGDNSLLPRIVEAAESGRLRIIGDGNNLIDMTYVDNLLHGLILAATHGERGEILTITNDEPLALWPMLKRLLRDLSQEDARGRSERLRSVPLGVAMLAARFSQWNHRWRRRPGEPALTRYGVGLLARTQTFDIGQAKQRWRYRPLISMQQGLERTVFHWRMTTTPQSAESDAKERLKLRVLSTGFTTARKDRVQQGAAKVTMRLHATLALIEHPSQGKVLFDTGYAPRVADAMRRFPFQLYRWLTPVHCSERTTARAGLIELGVEPNEIRWVVLSHFHADHVGGLTDFPRAEVIATKAAWESAQYSGFASLRRGVLPDLLPKDLSERIFLLDEFHDPGLGPFRVCHDFFGDGSLRFFYLPGHAAGQVGALAMTSDGPQFLVADAAWTTETITSPLPLTWAFRKIAMSETEAEATHRALHELHKTWPGVEWTPTHCSDVAERWNFDEQLSSVDPSL